MRKIVTTIFFTALYFKNNPVIVLTSVGVPDNIDLASTDFGDMRLETLQSITAEVVRSLQRDAHIVFKEVPSISH